MGPAGKHFARKHKRCTILIRMMCIVGTLNRVVEAELEALPADMRARLSYIAALIESFGLQNVREPHIRHLHGSLWEVRMKGETGISRAIHVAVEEQQMTVVRVIRKRRGKREKQHQTRSGTSPKEVRAMAIMRDLHRKWMKDAAYQEACDELEPEYEIARALIQLRTEAGLTQDELAKRINTRQSTIARLEGGYSRPSISALLSIARATG